MGELPSEFERFCREQSEIADAYEKLGKAVHGAGPLDDKTRSLIKLAVSVGAQREGAVHAHTRKALAAGASADEILHTAHLSLPTLGFPAMMAARCWVNDVLDKKR